MGEKPPPNVSTLVEQQVEVVALDKDRVAVETAMRLDVALFTRARDVQTGESEWRGKNLSHTPNTYTKTTTLSLIYPFADHHTEMRHTV